MLETWGNAMKSVFGSGSATDLTRVAHRAPIDSLQSIGEGKPIPNPRRRLGRHGSDREAFGLGPSRLETLPIITLARPSVNECAMI